MNKIVVNRKWIDNGDVEKVMNQGIDYEITKYRFTIDFSEFEDEMSVFDYMLDELGFTIEETLTLMSESVEGGYDEFVEDVKIRFGM